MTKKTLFLMLVVLSFSGCVSNKMLKEQIAEAIKENPQIVLQAMRENSIDVLEIVEQGIDAREEVKRKARFESELSTPYKPYMWPERASLGNPNAPVTIVEYTDFLCPYCSKGAQVVRKLVAENPEKFRLLFKHLPMHEQSSELAAIFEALNMIDKDLAFKFHDLAFARQKALYNDKDGVVLGQILAELNVDMDKLQSSMQSPRIQEYLLNDDREAREFGFDATPTFLVNGVSIRGYLPYERFKSMVDLILEKSPKGDADDGEVCEDCLNQM